MYSIKKKNLGNKENSGYHHPNKHLSCSPCETRVANRPAIRRDLLAHQVNSAHSRLAEGAPQCHRVPEAATSREWSSPHPPHCSN